jgi:hypothetical protein
MTKPERILDDSPEMPEETLLVVQRYYHLARKFADKYDFSLQLYMYPVSTAEIETVIYAEDKLAAAEKLMTEKINRW